MITVLDANEHTHINKHSVISVFHVSTIVHVNYMYQRVHELIHHHEVTATIYMDNMDGIFKLID